MKRLFLILTAFVLVFPSLNQIHSKRTISENDLRTYVCILAADSLEGRYVGTHGYNTATRYAQQEFKKAGLKTILTDGREESWFQPIILENHKLSKDSTSLTLTFGKTQKNYFGTENFCFPNLGIDNRYETSGNAVFVGYGIKEPDYGWDDYKNIDLRDKWVFMIDRIPDSLIKKRMSGYPSERLKNLLAGNLRERYVIEAGGIGIVKILFRDMEPSWERIKDLFSDWTTPKMQDSDYKSRIPTIILKPVLIKEIFKDMPYDPVNQKGHYSSFELDNLFLRVKKVYHVSPIFSHNLIGIVKGSDPSLKNEFITIGAHLDHLKGNKENIFNGADDNASGCAAVLAIAKAVAQSSPKRSVLFILYTAEELGMVGSRHFLSNAPIPVESIKMNINLDMIGRPDGEANELLFISAGKLNQAIKNLICNINSRTVKIPLDTVDKKSFAFRSDQFTFGQKRIQNVFFSTGEHKDYHQTTDDADKLDYGFLRRVSQLSYVVLMELANSDFPEMFSNN